METLHPCPAPSVHRSPRRRIPDRRRSRIGLTLLLVLALAIFAGACGSASSSDGAAGAPLDAPAVEVPAAPSGPDANDDTAGRGPTAAPEPPGTTTTVVPLDDEVGVTDESDEDAPSGGAAADDQPARPASVPTVASPTAAPTTPAPASTSPASAPVAPIPTPTAPSNQAVPPAPTPAPSPTPTPAGPSGVSITCGIAPRGQVEVHEVVTLSAGQFPGNVAISYTFDHGDGTREPGPLSYANYLAPGNYPVKLSWSYNGRTGTIDCGTVKVVPASNTSVTVRCGISPRRDVVVGERLTFSAEHTPAYADVAYAFDHGDGTIDRRQVSTAYYDAVGAYAVKLRWSAGNRSGTVDCGTVRVVAATPSPAVDVTCTISKREVLVGEMVTLTASHSPQAVPVGYAFDHGDGTVDRTPRSQAYYDRPGAYDVLLHWTSGSRSGTVDCGQVRVLSTTQPAPVTPGR